MLFAVLLLCVSFTEAFPKMMIFLQTTEILQVLCVEEGRVRVSVEKRGTRSGYESVCVWRSRFALRGAKCVCSRAQLR